MRNRTSQLLLSSLHLQRCDPAGSIHYRSKISLISSLTVFCCTEKQWLLATVLAAACRNSGKEAPGTRSLRTFWMRLFCPRTGGMAVVFIGKRLLWQFMACHLTLICSKLRIEIRKFKANKKLLKMYKTHDVMGYLRSSIKFLHTAVNLGCI